MPRLQTSLQGKAAELAAMAATDPSRQAFYVADMVSDGEAVLAARAMGARNLRFVGVTHEYGYNLPRMLHAFAEAHRNETILAESLPHVIGFLRTLELNNKP